MRKEENYNLRRLLASDSYKSTTISTKDNTGTAFARLVRIKKTNNTSAVQNRIISASFNLMVAGSGGTNSAYSTLLTIKVENVGTGAPRLHAFTANLVPGLTIVSDSDTDYFYICVKTSDSYSRVYLNQISGGNGFYTSYNEGFSYNPISPVTINSYNSYVSTTALESISRRVMRSNIGASGTSNYVLNFARFQFGPSTFSDITLKLLIVASNPGDSAYVTFFVRKLAADVDATVSVIVESVFNKSVFDDTCFFITYSDNSTFDLWIKKKTDVVRASIYELGYAVGNGAATYNTNNVWVVEPAFDHKVVGIYQFDKASAIDLSDGINDSKYLTPLRNKNYLDSRLSGFSFFKAITTAGNSSNINTWTKIATVNFGSTTATDITLVLNFLSRGYTQACEVAFSIRQNDASTPPVLSATILNKSNETINIFDSNSFKIVNNGFGTDYTIYLRKASYYCTISVFEVAKAIGSGTLTYFSNQSWSATEPIGTYMAISDVIHVKGNIISKSSAYTVTKDDYGQNSSLIILLDASTGAFNLTMPSSGSLIGMTTKLIKIDASTNIPTIKANASELINTANTDASLTSQFSKMILESDGTKLYKF